MCYAKDVDRDRLPIPDPLAQLRTDLVPLYDVPIEECYRMIIKLTNLLVVAGHCLETTGNPALAQGVLTEAATILDDLMRMLRSFCAEYLLLKPIQYPVKVT